MQPLKIGVCESTRPPIKQTQGPDAAAIVEYQWIAGIKSYPRFIDNERIIRKSTILERVWNNQRFSVVNYVCAKGGITRTLFIADTHARFEPLPILVNETDGSHWHIKKCCRETGDAVKSLLRPGIQDFESA
jgi:hypothetical protein